MFIASPIAVSRGLRLILAGLQADADAALASLNQVLTEIGDVEEYAAVLTTVVGEFTDQLIDTGVQEDWEKAAIERLAALSVHWKRPRPQGDKPAPIVLFDRTQALAEIEDGIDRAIDDVRTGECQTTSELAEAIQGSCVIVADKMGNGAEAANTIITTLSMQLATCLQRLAADG